MVLLRTTISELFTENKSKSLDIQDFVNIGDMAEGWLGATIAARFLFPERDIVPDDVYKIIQQLDTNQNISKTIATIKRKSFRRAGNPKIKNSQPDTINLLIGLNTSNFKHLVSYKIFQQNTSLIQSAIKFASSPKIMSYVQKVYEDPKQNIIDVMSVGTENQKGTKIDLKVLVDYKPISWGLISLKTGSTKQLGQIGKSWAGDPEAKQFTRGIYDLFYSLFGVTINENLKEPYLNSLQSGDYDVIMSDIELIYKDAYDKIAARFGKGEKELIAFLKTFANGVEYEATLNKKGIILIHLSKSDFKVIDFKKLLKFIDTKEIEVEIQYLPTGDNLAPKLVLSMKVDGKDFGNLVSIRPKIRIKDGKLHEFRHYVEKEPGLAKLLSISS